MKVFCSVCTYTEGEVGSVCKCCQSIYVAVEQPATLKVTNKSLEAAIKRPSNFLDLSHLKQQQYSWQTFSGTGMCSTWTTKLSNGVVVTIGLESDMSLPPYKAWIEPYATSFIGKGINGSEAINRMIEIHELNGRDIK